MTFTRRPAHERVFLAHVEDVKLVDPRRQDQERALVHDLRERRILHELHEVVLIDNFAWRNREIAADLEGVGVGHLHADLLAVAALQVLEQVVQSLHEVLSAGGDGLAQYFRVREHEVGGRQRVDVLPGIEVDFARGVLVEAFDAADRLVQVLGGDQVRLLDVVVEKILLPVVVLEAAVAFGRLNHGLRVLAEELQHRVLPQGRIVLPQFHLHLGELGGVGKEFAGHFVKRPGDTQFVAERRHAGRALTGDIVGHELAAALRDLRVDLCQLLRIRRGCCLRFTHALFLRKFGIARARYTRE